MSEFSWRRELADSVSRFRLGGLFYVAGWIMVGLADDAVRRSPAVFAAGLAALLALALVRLRPAPFSPDAAAAARRIGELWLVVWATTALWGIAAAWLLASGGGDAARTLMLVLTGAYATAIAHALAMRACRAGLAIVMLFLPSLVVLAATPGARLLAASFATYLLYILLAMKRSNGEYWQRVELEENICRQRDFYEQQSRRDALTGLPNRRRFDAALAHLLSRPIEARQQALSLILFDLDGFKAINDRHGHAAGDRCLVAFSRLLVDAFSGPDEVPARLGGEEFAVLLPGSGVDDALDRAERVRRQLADCGVPQGRNAICVTVSGGVVCRAGNEPAESLMTRADAALYEAKRTGRNRTVIGPVPEPLATLDSGGAARVVGTIDALAVQPG